MGYNTTHIDIFELINVFLPSLSENEIPEFGIIKITFNKFKNNTFKEAWAGIICLSGV